MRGSTDPAKRAHGNTQTWGGGGRRPSGSCCVSWLGRARGQQEANPPPTTKTDAHHFDALHLHNQGAACVSTPARISILPHCCTAKHPPTSGQEGGSGPHPGHPRQSWEAIEMPPSGQHEHHSGTPVESETNRDCLSLSGQGPSRTECPPAATHLVAVWDLAACLAGLAPWEQQFVGLLCIRTLCFVCMPCSSIIAGNCGRQGRERSLQIDSSRDFSIASPVQRHPAPINELHFTRSTLPFQPSRESTITRLATPATNPPNAAIGSSLDTHNTGRHARTHTQTTETPT